MVFDQIKNLNCDCSKVIQLWNRPTKTDTDIGCLQKLVVKFFKLERTKWDQPTQQLLYILKCRVCGNTIMVPAIV